MVTFALLTDILPLIIPCSEIIFEILPFSTQKIEENQVQREEKKQVKNSPYGQWTTVQTFEPPPQT